VAIADRAYQMAVGYARDRVQGRPVDGSMNGAAPIIYLYETPYPVAFRKNAKGFIQIPLGNNLFEAAYVEK